MIQSLHPKNLFGLFLLLFLSLPVSSFASVKIGDLYYNLDDTNRTAEVTYEIYYSLENYSYLSGNLSIPNFFEYNGIRYSVTSIGNSAFSWCEGLTSVEIPNSITSIGGKAFYGCRGLTSVEIPNSVTSIGNSAFSWCQGLISVEIPNSITSIGGDAFDGCRGLTSVTIPNSVTEIGDGAFRNCSGLTSIEIPNSVSSIGNYVFYGCIGLTSVYNYALQPQDIDASVFNGIDKKNVTFFVPDESLGFYKAADVWKEFNILGFSNQFVNPVKIGDFYYNLHGDKTAEVTYEKYNSNENYSYFTGNLTIPSIVEYNGLEYSVSSIGNSAFYGCSGLTSVTIPDSVTEIGDGAFRNCSGLTSVIIPNSVTSIGGEAFYGCRGLTSVEIPSSVTEIGDGAFRNCNGLTGVEIPNSIINIGKYAFEGCSGLTSVEIPNSVSTIGHYAFYGCRGLTSVEIPNSVTSIGSNAFSYCSNLKTVYNFRVQPQEINSFVFENINLKYVTLFVPDESIELYKVADVWKDFIIVGISESEKIQNHVKIDDLYYNILGDKTSEVTYEKYNSNENYSYFTGNLTIPKIVEYNGLEYSVSSIGNSAFYGCSGLTSVTIPNSVTEIGDGAFRNCSGLTNIEIPNSVTSIGDYTFFDCRDLTSVEIPNSVSSIGDYAFSGCVRLTNVKMPISVISIGDYTFFCCYGLTSIEIPNSVTEIGNSAFSNCSHLNTVYNYAPQPQDIDASVFDGIDKKNVTLFVPDESLGLYKAADVWKEFNILSFSNQFVNPVKIGDLFYNLHSDNTAEVTYEKYNSNENYSYLPGYLSIPNFIEYNGIGYSVTSIGNSAFSWCEGLISVEIGNSVTEIGDYAFSKCEGLMSIEIPNSVTSIGNYAFSVCIRMTSVTIPNSVISIGNGAFWNCVGLTSVEIPNSVTSIGNYVFYSCSGLRNIDIPNSVTTIGNYAFGNCRNLTIINNYAPQPQVIDSSVFDRNNLKSITLFVPDESVDSYKTADIWKEFNILGFSNQFVNPVKIGDFYYNLHGDKTAEVTYEKYNSNENYSYFTGNLTIPSIVEYNVLEYSVSSIGNSAFYGCSGLTSVTIPNSVTEIGNSAFYGCSGLTSVTIPNSVSSIGNSAFIVCSSLTSVIIPNSVTEIGDYAFSGCNSLPSIIIPNSVTKIGDYAFSGCVRLTSVTIPNSVISIGNGAFWNCVRLTSVEIPNSVTEIGGYTFAYCNWLTSVYNYALQPQVIEASVFKDVNINSVTLFVPEESVDLYKTAEVWKEFNIVGIQVGGSDPDPDPEIEFEEKIVNVFYIDKDDYTLHTQTVTLNLPVPEQIDGYTFRKWVVLAGDLDDGIQIQAQYVDNDTMKTDSILGDESSDATRKVIRAGKVYILKGDKVFDTNGHELNRKF